MKQAADLMRFVLNRLEQVYEQPLVYGRTAEGVDLILHYYHELWAFLAGRDGDFRRVSRDAHAAQLGGSGPFVTQYRWYEPAASDEEVVEYIVNRWREISDRLGVPLPWKAFDEPAGQTW
ncbi:MAG TPA: hypothetical protein VFA18_11015 [Gemmataceae bacterium]|nr:hypothetical protein [Gemmataceae bacterium]